MGDWRYKKQSRGTVCRFTRWVQRCIGRWAWAVPGDLPNNQHTAASLNADVSKFLMTRTVVQVQWKHCFNASDGAQRAHCACIGRGGLASPGAHTPRAQHLVGGNRCACKRAQERQWAYVATNVADSPAMAAPTCRKAGACCSSRRSEPRVTHAGRAAGCQTPVPKYKFHTPCCVSLTLTSHLPARSRRRCSPHLRGPNLGHVESQTIPNA